MSVPWAKRLKGLLIIAITLGAACSGSEPTKPTALEGPTEASALEFVNDAANQAAFERFGILSKPRVALEARIDGNCAAVRFLEQSEDTETEPWTVFLRWEEGDWDPRGVTLIPDAHTLLNQSVSDCYG